MNFKCNFCHRTIDYRSWGKPEINCPCGAEYVKTVIVEIKEKE